jgi:ribulose-phosphate 3-epimerase
VRRTIAPSLLSADFGHLAHEVQAVARAGADWLHVDVMDGHFVPNITIGAPVVAAVRKTTALPLDVHLMISEPGRYVARFVEAGAAWISVHQEACPDLRATLREIRALGARPSIAINPDTPLDSVADALPEADMLLVMSVHPGFGGQTFIASALDKIVAARRVREAAGARFLIEVDGGITVENVGRAAAAGADVIVAGTAIFGAADVDAAIASMRTAIDESLR